MALYVLSDAYRKSAKCTIRVGAVQRTITDPYAFVTEVRVENRRGQAAAAVLQLTRRQPQRRRAVSEAALFGLGEPIAIEADFNGYCEEVMRGFIGTLQADYTQPCRHPDQVTVHCQDESLPLERERVRRRWGADAPVTDRFIVTTVLSRYGLLLDPDSGEGARSAQLQQDDTDLGFLRSRARVNGYELLFRAGRVYFGPPRWQAKPQNSIRVQRDAACQEFAVRRADVQPERTVLLYRAQGALSGHHYGHVLRVGEPVGVSGLNERHDSVYYVDAVSHRFTAAGYWQVFTLLRRSGEALSDLTIIPGKRPGLLYQVL